ncbi:hypothetical protein ACJMK2_028153 [Sinanodonta woodiana]|uniref:Protein-tyrosine-phosphatase n=1 Tax=Sinanodonta woodiana TaxID=1069815 RepID=A0ABD3XA58_SINWO
MPDTSSEGTTSSVSSSTTTATTTTSPVTTTQPPLIGGHCENNQTCTHMNNTECKNYSCQCINGTFNVNNRTCILVSDLKPQNTSLVVETTFITLKWSQYSDPVRQLIMNGTLEIVVKVKELPATINCSVNTSTDYAYCTGLNLTHGAMYTLDFIIIQVQSNETVYNITFHDSVAPGQPGAINKTSDFGAPNISLNWEASPGLVDNYTVTVTEVNENKYVMNTTLGSNSTTIEVNELRHGRNYTVVIVANRLGKTSDPRTDYFSTVIIAPEPPTNVSEMPGSIGNTSLNLTWTRPVDFNGPPMGYKVCVKKQIYSDEPWHDEYCITNDSKNVEWMEVSNLTAGAFYWFTVYSLNSKYNSTPANSSIITTNESTPDVVKVVKLEPFDFNIEVNFTRPERPYGKIVAYSIKVRNSDNGSDCHVWWLVIPGFPVNGSVGENWTNCRLNPQINIYENQKQMFINLTNLLPDTFYSIEIMAHTKVGPGISVNSSLNTSETVPGNVTNLKGKSISSTEITVNWIAPVIRPGKTVYHVEVHDMITDTIVQRLTVNGYENQSLTVRDLKEYWVYRFEVYANTSKGYSSVVISDNVTTEEAAPGAATDLKVIYYNESNYCNARRVNFTWNDPKLEDRNGKIVQYIIEITKGIVPTYIKNITDPDPYSNWSLTWWKDLDVLPDEDYYLQVQAITETRKEGMKANTSFKSIICKPPPYDTNVVLIMSPEIQISSVTVNLHLDFFRNNGQGSITEYGLVVSDSNMENIDVKDISDGTNRFPFKSRSSDLEKKVQNGANYTSYAVENLPEDQDIYLMMYACTTAGCTTSKYYGPFKTSKQDTSPNVAAILVPIIVVLLMISVVSFMLYRKGYHVRILTVLRKSRPPQESVNFNHISEMNENIVRKRPFKLSMLDEHLEEMNKDSKLGFAKEYEDIQRLSPKHSTEAALLGENKSKNRWVNILAFDHSRVKLQLLDEDDPTSDYINANFIPDLKRQRVYIATQGPLPGTIDDFWRMIWEHKVSIIVMLTKCKEGSRVKCEMYWPNELHEAKQYGDIVVKPISISNLDKFDINVFDVSMNEEMRRVMHFHFQEFPDFSADVDFLTFVNFVKTVRQHSPHKMQGPIVVHCSAGVGRTGTYITVDCLQQLIDSPDFDFNTEVDIFDYVLTMRDHRTLMVQVEFNYHSHTCIKSNNQQISLYVLYILFLENLSLYDGITNIYH